MGLIVKNILYEQENSDIPQIKSYLEKNSAVAKRAMKYGYYIVVISEVLEFRSE